MGRYDKANNRAVKRGLDWLAGRRDIIVEAGMVQLLQAASQYALSIHDHSHFGHRIAGNSHGWALIKDRKVLTLAVNEGHHGEGDAERQLRAAASGVSSKGYVGIILASLTATRDNGSPIMFEIEFEMDVLLETQEEIINNFSTYFTPI